LAKQKQLIVVTVQAILTIEAEGWNIDKSTSPKVKNFIAYGIVLNISLGIIATCVRIQ